MILKFWPRWPRKWPLNLSSLGGRPLDFNLNGIFEISGLHWSKWAIACLIRRTFIFWIFSLQPPRLLRNWKNESFRNKAIYSSFRSMETPDFENAIWIKIQWTFVIYIGDLKLQKLKNDHLESYCGVCVKGSYIFTMFLLNPRQTLWSYFPKFVQKL